MKRTIFTVFALCFFVTASMADPPARNHKLQRHLKSGKSEKPNLIPMKEVKHVSDITLPEISFRKNKAYLSRKTRRPIHIIKNSKNEYHYRARNHKFKYSQ